MTNKCETARHVDMPKGCTNAKHEHCGDCAGCYTCHADALPISDAGSSTWKGGV